MLRRLPRSLALRIRAADGTILDANGRAAELTGYRRDELVSRSAESLCEPVAGRASPFGYDAQENDEVVVAEHALKRQDGSAVPVEISSRRMPDGTYQGILRDISERRRAEAERLALEARLRQSQKMEAIGRLAGGVAHDFNNLLTAITGSLTLAMRDVPKEARAYRWLREVDNAAWRAAGLMLSCPSGEAALATARAHSGPVHLLLSDLMMPGMNGRKLARRLAETRPGLGVLFTSGYGQDVAARQGALEPGVHFLEKPYSLATLARKVRESLAD